ncbi:MAG: hypothetical protein RLY43_431, partial [Bacteroidota bacterium]
MKKIFVLVVSGAFFISCSTSKTVTQAPKKEVDVVKYMNTISESNLSKNLYVIASDEMEGRNTGEPGQKRAGL